MNTSHLGLSQCVVPLHLLITRHPWLPPFARLGITPRELLVAILIIKESQWWT